MSFPVEQRLKILEKIVFESEKIRGDAPSVKPQAMPGMIVGFGTRSDGGSYLKVVPLAPTGVTTHGEITWPSSNNTNPNDFFVPVFPFDVTPAQVQSQYKVGQPILMLPYWGVGANADGVRGTYVCVQAGTDSYSAVITSNIGVAKYQGVIQQGSVTTFPTTGLTNDGPSCLIYNLCEIGSTASFPFMSAGNEFIGRYMGVDSATGLIVLHGNGFFVNQCGTAAPIGSGSGSGSGS